MRTLFTQTATTTLANTTTQTTLVGSGVGAMSLPPGILVVGRSIRLKWYGKIASILTPTFLITYKVGGTSFAATATLTLPVLTGTKMIMGELIMTCITTGTTGTVLTQGFGVIDNAAAAVAQGMLNSSTNTVNTTIVNALDLMGTWGTASASNTVTLTNMTLELFN